MIDSLAAGAEKILCDALYNGEGRTECWECFS